MFTTLEDEMKAITVKNHYGMVKSVWNSTNGRVVVYDNAKIGKVFSRNEYSADMINEYIHTLETRGKGFHNKVK